MKNIDSLIQDLPDAEAARRFFEQFGEKHPSQINKLVKNDGLLSDALTIAAYSPLLAATLLQNPAYIWWLSRHRANPKIRDKEELLESLARFSLTNSMVDPQILLARFRRRELLRIFLYDIRRLATVSEITEEISNLADAILEWALRLARQELDNRYGTPLETDSKGRAKPAAFCIVSLGKLGSKELNYSSDIDLLFVYSGEGTTSGHGTRAAVTNREYFVKLAEFIVKLVGEQTGEGAAYRVDLRLRPHGRVGALALSVKDTVRYYQREAKSWERQVLIRSRASAGGIELYRDFIGEVEDFVFSRDETVENALENVRLSKQRIDFEKNSGAATNVKLGRGGIREIEFIAQALQLAYGGHDRWLRVSHTLKSLSRLADRALLTENELTELFDAYEFLRRTEHLLQMENGLQTHLVPTDRERRLLLARRMRFDDVEDFDASLRLHMESVSRIFGRVFAFRDPAAGKNGPTAGQPREAEAGRTEITAAGPERAAPQKQAPGRQKQKPERRLAQPILSSLEKSEIEFDLTPDRAEMLERLSEVSPHFAEMLAANPALVLSLPDLGAGIIEKDYTHNLLSAVRSEKDFAGRLAALRRTWASLLLEIVIFDVFEKLSLTEARRLQTGLAEASIEAAFFITEKALEGRFGQKIDRLPLAVLGLGKAGGKGMDYGSDLDLVMIYDDHGARPGLSGGSGSEGVAPDPRTGPHSDAGRRSPENAAFYARAVEIFVTAISSMTRDGSLYRVDLRLRPDGKNGPPASGKAAFLDYLRNRSAIWEWLAYVKLRGVGGDTALASAVEREARDLIHRNASAADPFELRTETWRVRERLQAEKASPRRSREIDIKFGEGGLLDVYFAVRYLQLRDNIPDDEANRSTGFMLGRLRENEALSAADFADLKGGYEFLSELDHQLRLTVGRSTRLPLANQPALEIVARRMKLGSVGELLEKLTFHRLNIRQSFEKILRD